VGLSDPQRLNRYVYASNNPTSETDPSGLTAGPPIFLYRKPCPSIFHDFFGSFACNFGITQVSGGYYSPDLSTGAMSEDEGGGGLLVYGGVLVTVGLIDLGVFLRDSLNPSKPGRVPPPPGSDGGGDGSGVTTSSGGSGPWPTTTPAFTGGIGPITTFPGTEGLTAGIGSFGTSALTSWPTGNLAIDNIYGTLAKPIRWVKNHPDIGRLCVAGAVVAGLGLFAWQIGESARQTRGSLDPRGDIGIVLAGCLVGIGFLALIPT